LVNATSIDSSPPTNNALAEQWRALSRLGYGPNAALLREIQAASSPREWALQQLDAAWHASQSAPLMANEVQEINAPLPQIFEGVQREREARASLKTAEQTVVKGSSGNVAPAGDAASTGNGRSHQRLDFSIPPEPQNFNRTMVEKTDVWRLQACSQPDIENVLLARMTEFWFNHLNVYIGKGPVRPFVGHYLINVRVPMR
jgi:hypothetical protein